MTTLLTGGTSQIGLALAQRLKAAGKGVVFGTRTPSKIPSGYKHVLLDWADPSTFENPFSSTESKIDTVYILAPPITLNALEITKPFIDLAIEKGVKRFVLLSATIIEKGGLMAGEIHEYLDSKGVDYFVLRPTWFIGMCPLPNTRVSNPSVTDDVDTENLFTAQAFTIRGQGEIITAVPKGRIPFVSVEDIAQAAFEYITQGSSTKDKLIIGPEVLTYDEVSPATAFFEDSCSNCH
jgi:nucleoside-diphosphate-sugar epimerase